MGIRLIQIYYICASVIVDHTYSHKVVYKLLAIVPLLTAVYVVRVNYTLLCEHRFCLYWCSYASSLTPYYICCSCVYIFVGGYFLLGQVSELVQVPELVYKSSIVQVVDVCPDRRHLSCIVYNFFLSPNDIILRHPFLSNVCLGVYVPSVGL